MDDMEMTQESPRGDTWHRTLKSGKRHQGSRGARSKRALLGQWHVLQPRR